MRSAEPLDDFVDYCHAHPQERFWQALRNWSGHNFILASQDKRGVISLDTFYWEGKTGRRVERERAR